MVMIVPVVFYARSLGYVIFNFTKRDFPKAEEQFLKSYALSKDVGDERLQLENIIWLSEIYIGKGKISIAERYLKEAEEIIRKKSPFNLELIGIYAQFFKLYEKTKTSKRCLSIKINIFPLRIVFSTKS